jgi:hypothetical protein
MSVQIELPCGCHINAAFVLGLCPTHSLELLQKQREADAAYRRYEQAMQEHTSTSREPHG